MSPPQLVSPKQPLAIRTEHIAQAPTTLRVRQDKAFSDRAFSIIRESDGANLFTVDGKLMSWSQKRAVRDASGLPIFDIYRKTFGSSWHVELPGEKSNDPILKVSSKFSMFKDKLDLTLRNAANDRQVANLEVRGQDIWKSRTNVYYGGAAVMTVKRTDKMTAYIPGKRFEWLVDVSEGFDTSLAAAIVIVLAAVLYDNQKSAAS